MDSKQTAPNEWELHIYVRSGGPRAAVAIANLRRLCDECLAGRYRITVLDLAKEPQRARREQILALPTVVRRQPLPERRVIGTLSKAAEAIAALEMRAAG